MRIRNIVFLLFCIFLFFSALFSWNYWRSRDWIEVFLYDISHPQEYINTQAGIEQTFNALEVVSYSDLPTEYLTYTQSNKKPFQAMLRHKTYYKVKGRDIYRKVIGDHRIRDFLPKDKYYRNHLKELGNESVLYLLLDKKLIYKFLELKKELRAQGYNPEGYHLRSVHRHPLHNKRVKGANQSKHILGEALDLGIRDVNKDGRSNQEDKQIVLEILDKKIIRNKGGIGLYPNTQSVHFDVRGSHARWNTY